jgi:hypothetical protein
MRACTSTRSVRKKSAKVEERKPARERQAVQ